MNRINRQPSPYQHFRRMAQGIDVGAALHDALNVNLSRVVRETPGLDKSVHFQVLGDKTDGLNPAHLKSCSWGAIFEAPTPALRQVVLNAKCMLPAKELFYYAMLRIMPPQSKMKRHIDRMGDGLLPTQRRYHLVFQAGPGFMFDIDGERCSDFQAGDLWHVDTAKRPHFVENNDEMPRVAILLDTLTDENILRNNHPYYRPHHY